MTNKNATVIESETAISLISYKTLVAMYVRRTGTLYFDKNKYSKTTSQHLNEFRRMLVVRLAQPVLEEVPMDKVEKVKILELA